MDELNKKGKNCFIAFRSKKLNNFDIENSIIKNILSFGCYFDRITFVPFDDRNEIALALMESKDCFENVFICYPNVMYGALVGLISSLYSSSFNENGILISDKGCVFMLCADSELSNLVDVRKVIDINRGTTFDVEYFKTVGATSSIIKETLELASDIDKESVKKYCCFNVSESYGECTIEMLYSKEVQNKLIDDIKRVLVTSLKEYLYAVDNSSLEKNLAMLLKLCNKKLSIAESFTGGGICKKLVSIAGISEVLMEGLNVYSNDAKVQRLGVRESTLKHYGAVSEATAREMAKGLLNNGKSNMCIVTTGIAGPKSDGSLKPIGLCYIAIGTEEKITVHEYKLKGNREEITETAINLALFLAYKTLKQ